MMKIAYTALSSKFSELSDLARNGHPVLITKEGEPFLLLAHPSLMTEEEHQACESVTSTALYQSMGRYCSRIETEGAKFLITAHGIARCCMMPAELSLVARARKVH